MIKFLLWIFQGAKAAWDEKRVWGVAFVLLGIIYPLAGGADSAVIIALVTIGTVLYAGIALDKTPLEAGCGSLGFFLDLVTDKRNKFDSIRVVGNLILLAAMAYVIMGLSLGLPIQTSVLVTLGAFGILLFGAAVATDKKAA